MLQRIARIRALHLSKTAADMVFALLAWSLLTIPSALAADALPLNGDMQRLVLVKERAMAPDAEFLDANGNTVAVSDFKGKVLLLNFWATWCPPCIREMPALDRLQEDLGGEDLVVVAVSTDAGGKAVAGPYLRDRLGLTNLDLYLDPKFNAWKTYQGGGLPTSFIIDRQGRLVGALVGEAEWDGDDAKALFRQLLGETVEISG